jgi:RHS repeat-associated protein
VPGHWGLDMRFVARRLLLLVLLLVAVDCSCWPGGSVASSGVVSETSPAGSPGTGVSPLADGLVVPAMETLDEGQQVAGARRARWDSPAAVVAREASRTAYRGLSAARARRVAAEAFPGLVDAPAAGPPELARGQRIVRYPADDEAQVALAGGRHGLIVSTQPMAVQGPGGERVPVNLALKGLGDGFVPQTPVVGVWIPRRLGDGVALSGSGISLTPVDAQGSPLGGSEGAVDGASVLYANTQLDSDTAAKPVAGGFELDSLLRSPQSPGVLYFRVGLPAGARLVATGRSGAARVEDRGRALAAIGAPSAEDAEGRPVPAQMSVAGDRLRVSVGVGSGAWRYPIEVDPTIEENVEGKGTILFGKTWSFFTEQPSFFKEAKRPYGDSEAFSDRMEGEASAGDYGVFFYRTQGQSRIYSLTASTYHSVGLEGRVVENVLGILNPHSRSLEAQQSWIGGNEENTTSLCSVSGCATGEVTSGDDESEAVFKQDLRERAEGSHIVGESVLRSAEVGIVQTAGPSASWDTTDQTFRKESGEQPYPNPLVPGTWISERFTDYAGLDGSDPGVGIQRISWRSPNDSSWGGESVDKPADGAAQMHECEEAKCGGSPQLVSGLGELPEGEDQVEGTVEDAVGLKASATATVKVDRSPPYGVALVGMPPNNELGFGHDRVEVTASDGSGTTPAAGVRSIKLYIDGQRIGGTSGSCSAPAGPCTATAEFEVNGEEFWAGGNYVDMVAEDAAGNVTEEHASIIFVGSEARPVGPGSVNLASGAFTLEATDVSMAAPGSSLAVQRTFDSRLVGADKESPFGPQWQGLGFTGYQDLTKLSTGSVVLTAATGQRSIFAKEGSAFVSPVGDSNLVLKEESPSAFTLSDQHGDVTRFTVPEGGSGSVLTPQSSEEPGHAGAVTYKFQTVGGVTEPTEALAPPAGVNCETLVRGCRALTFAYATKTTASGEAPSEWGEYSGRLMTVDFTAYNPATKAMQTTAVAQYAYDKQGRLRAEWDPRISPALETTYGYDAEGHVTAVTAPGQQPWLLHYGTIASDPTPGRLLSATRPSASTPLAQSTAPVSESAPQFSAAPVVGSELTVSQGTWSNSPLSYGYQWERCNSAGAACEAIAGATNQGYTPRHDDDEGHTFLVLVTATNSGGSTTVPSSPSALLPLIPTEDFAPEYYKAFGSKGTGKAEFESPSYIAYSTVAKVFYVTDTGNNRVEYFDPEGQYEGKFGSSATKESELLDAPTGIASISEDGLEELWVADPGHKRVVMYNSFYKKAPPPEYVREAASSAALGGIAIDEGAFFGAALIANDTTNALDCLTGWAALEGLTGFGATCPVASFGEAGSGHGQFSDPADVAVSPPTAPTHGEIYVLDTGNDRVEYFSGATGHFGEYLGQFGEAGSKLGQFEEPMGIAVGAEGNVWVADTGNDRIEEFSPSGEAVRELGEPSVKIAEKPKETKKEREAREAQELAPEHFNRPMGITIGPDGLAVVDSGNDRVQQWEEPRRPAEGPLPPGTPPATGTAATWTIDYGVPVSGSGAPYPLGTTEVEALGQKDDPKEGTAIFPPDEPMGWPAKDYRRANIYYLDDKDRTVDTATPSGGIATAEYNAQSDVVRTLSADNRAQALKEGTNGMSLSSLSTYNSEGTELQSTTGPEHTVVLADGKEAPARKITRYSYNEGAPSEGGPFALVTKQTTATMNEKSDTEETGRTTTTAYSGQENLGWKLRKPTSTTGDVGDLNLTHTTLYEKETGNVSETRPPKDTTEKSPHASETVYYTAAANSKVAACGEHPEWANLPCQTRPAKQPETTGLPGLPVTTVTYNVWDEPEQTSETVEVKSGKGSEMLTRTKTETYDAAGRLKTSSVSATVGAALPTVTNEYSPTTGALVTQSTTSEGTTRKLTSEYNTLGQLTAYTDADGNTSTYSYDIDGRPETVSDGKGTQTYSYDPTTGYLTKLVDSAAGTFTAGYDSEGRMLSEGYPNGMTAKYAYNALGEPVAVEYVKTTDCTSECTWYSDSVVPSIEGQWASQTSSLSSESYSYDGAGRLTQVQNTPTGKGCITRVYAYDADSNRTSLATHEPKSTGKCSTKGGTVEAHTYDEADRLIDPGVAYNPFGDITALPAGDAGGSELTSSFYTDNQLQSTTQHEQTVGFNLDPEGRTRETIDTGKLKNADIVSHYAGPGSTPAWTTNTSGEWTRNIPGINGQLAAVQDNGETPTLQLTNLHGDIVATAKDTEAATGLASTIGEPSEYGVPASEAPPKYSWLGAIEIPTELPSGVATMGVRSYVPQLGRFLQPDPDPSGSPDAYAYTFGDPLNETDQTGQYAEYAIGGPSAALLEWAATSSEEAAAQQAAENAAARAAAERAAQEALAAELAAYGPTAEGEEEWWEEWEEEGGYEEVVYQQGRSGGEEPHLESALLVQPLGEGAASGADGPAGSGLPLCVAGSEAPCARDVFRKGGNGGKRQHRPGSSRCEQYGGHWITTANGSSACAGVRSPEGDSGDPCRAIGGATAPLAAASGPGGWVLWAVGFGACWIP